MTIDYLISTQEDYISLYYKSRLNLGFFFYIGFSAHNDKLSRVLSSFQIEVQ